MANLLARPRHRDDGGGAGHRPRECALLAASEGARVIVNDPGVNPDGSGHDDDPAAQVVAEIKDAGGEATANFADVSSMEGGESVIQTALDAYGKLDGLINFAAILRDRMVFNMTEAGVGRRHPHRPEGPLHDDEAGGGAVPAAALRAHHQLLVRIGAPRQLGAGELRRGEGGRGRPDARRRA